MMSEERRQRRRIRKIERNHRRMASKIFGARVNGHLVVRIWAAGTSGGCYVTRNYPHIEELKETIPGGTFIEADELFYGTHGKDHQACIHVMKSERVTTSDDGVNSRSIVEDSDILHFLPGARPAYLAHENQTAVLATCPCVGDE